MRRINEALFLTLLVLGSPLAYSQNQYSSCERADDGRPLCTDAATGKMAFVSEDAFKTYAAHTSGIDTGSVTVEAGAENGTLKFPQSCEQTSGMGGVLISLAPSEAEKLGVDQESLVAAWIKRIPVEYQAEDSNGFRLLWRARQSEPSRHGDIPSPVVLVEDRREFDAKNKDNNDGVKAGCLKLISLVDQALVNQAKNLKNAKEKEIAAKAQLESQRKAEVSKSDANALAQWTAYVQRDKTLVEKVFNYSLVADEAGIDTFYAISGDKGNDDCVVTIYRKKFLEGEWDVTNVDIRKFNQEGFRISNERLPRCYGTNACLYWRYGDEKQYIKSKDDVGQRTDRLAKAWGLAFQQCPGKKSEF